MNQKRMRLQKWFLIFLIIQRRKKWINVNLQNVQ